MCFLQFFPKETPFPTFCPDISLTRMGLPPLLDQAGAKPEAPESKAAGSDGWLACHETQA